MRWLIVCFLILTLSKATRTACQTADFSKGKWLKIATTQRAIYQVTGAQLKQMGVTLPINSSKIQLFGFDLSALSEKVPSNVPPGNQEMSIEVKDGGDRNFDEIDRFIFYAPGNIVWEKWGTDLQWKHKKLHHSDTAFYFLTIGENGKRIESAKTVSSSTQKINTYHEHTLWENDSLNILNSGKLWLGSPMGQGAGKLSSISTNINTANLIETFPIVVNAQYVSTNYNQKAQFDFNWSDTKIKSTFINPVSGLVYDATANMVLDSFSFWPTKNSIANTNIALQYNALLGSTGWVDFVTFHLTKSLRFANQNTLFFHGKEAQSYLYELGDADASTMVWDISNPLNPLALTTSYTNNQISFTNNSAIQPSYFAFKQNAFESIVSIDSLSNQNILSNTEIDYLIIAPSTFQQAAIKLQNFHQKQNGYKVAIVDPVKIYNEFSGGLVHPVAIRNYVKWLQINASKNNLSFAKYLCIIGGADFNIKRLNKNNQVPVFESEASLDILNSYASDDFYAILKEGADINFPSSVNSLDIAIGRIPAKTNAEADTMVNKIIQYSLGNSRGIWQNQITWVADDGDYNLHLQDAESIVSGIQSKNNQWNHKKIYLDLYPATNTAGGVTYPLVVNEIAQNINNGSLVLNYTGHGNYLRLTEEAVINSASMQTWNNAGKLPLMITASCDFAPYDQPQLSPIGFNALMQNSNGIIGLVAANRLVFAYSNKQINEQFAQALLVPNKEGQYYSIGQSLQMAKNANWSMQGDRLNAFKFSLLGDPALTLSIAKNKIQLTIKDSLTAGTLTKLDGQIMKGQTIHSAFNGWVDCIVYDVIKEKNTLGNQASSIKTTVPTKDGILYRGKATVANGKFSVQFILPKETNTANGSISIQTFAYNQTEDAIGVANNIVVQPAFFIQQLDTIGPGINAFINDTNFTNNSWVSDRANLIIQLKDSSGIQSSGNALGHDLLFIVDDDVQNPFVLNNYFMADINTYQSGTIVYSLPKLSIGKHQLVIKAWDLLGNLSKDTLWFIVPAQELLKAKDLVNKPNPMVNFTQFSFDVNIQDPNLQTEFSLRNLNGQLLVNKVLPVVQNANKWVMNWDGRDQSGATIPPGFYFYTITVRSGQQSFVLSNKLMKL
jgi:Peptidase family C25